MKKILLFNVVMLLVSGSFAQTISTSNQWKPKLAYPQPVQTIVDETSSFYNFTNPNTDNLPTGSNSRSGVTKIKFASSRNLYGVLTSTQQCLSGDWDLNLISFTHRQCNSYPGNSGFIQTSFSTDGGSTWDSSLVVMSSTTDSCRYPSGGIFNPSGNTDPNNAFAIVSGPVTDGGTAVGGIGWIGNFFGSSQLDGTNNDQQFELNASTGVMYQQMARNSFTTTSLEKAYVLGSDLDYNAGATVYVPFNGIVVNTGTFNSGTNSFDWIRQKLAPSFWLDPTNSNHQSRASYGDIAFSADGNTGYVVILGIDSLTPYHIQPLIYKTVDAGQNWVYQTPYDFSTVTSLTSHLSPTLNDAAITFPMFSSQNGLDILVDNNNHLHIICQIMNSASTNPDSLAWYYGDSLVNKMFDVYETGTGWEAFFIDTIKSAPVYAGVSPWQPSTGGITYDARIQTSMTEDRTKFFYTWMDTNPSYDLSNTFPDIFCKGYDMANQKEAGPWNFTGGTQYDGDNYWLFASDKALISGNNYIVPVTTTQSQTAGDDGGHAANHYFIQGIGFSNADFYPLATNSIKDAATFNVSQNIPNPAKGTTSFSVNLTKAASVKVEVSNLLGQTVYSLPLQNLKSGISNVNLNISDLSAGIYFYTITVGAEKVTHKMIVE